MDKNILDFKEIRAGWMNMYVYDYINDSVRKMRISYLQPFFDDLLMGCKYLLSDITGVYEIYIDQEGFEAVIRFHKYHEEVIALEIKEDCFEDEIPYGTSAEEWENFNNQEPIPTTITYFNVHIKNFVENIVLLIDKHKQEYNEGFVLSPSDELNQKLMSQVKEMYYKKYLLGGDKECES